MKVQDAMMRTPASCSVDTNLAAAIEILWNRNCGMLPVVDANQKVVGVVTDRDLCVALGTRNRRAGEITVGEVVRKEVYSCQAEDDVRVALDTMASRRVRRLPVVNKEGRLEGILSMDNVVLHADLGGQARPSELSPADIVRVLHQIYEPQLPEVAQKRAAAV